MAVLGNVFASLQTMSLLQLLFGLVACTGYALAQGSLVAGRLRAVACGTALSAALGFVFEAPEWTYGVMLGAFAVAGFGLFVGAVCWLSALVGFNRDHAPAADSSFFNPESELESDAESESGVSATPPRPMVAPHASPAHSI